MFWISSDEAQDKILIFQQLNRIWVMRTSKYNAKFCRDLFGFYVVHLYERYTLIATVQLIVMFYSALSIVSPPPPPYSTW